MVEVVWGPSCEFSAELDGFFVGCGADEVEGEVSDDGHVFGAVSFSEAGLVVAEDDVEDPVEAVFDAPVPTNRLSGLGRGEVGRGDIVSGLGVGFGAALDLCRPTLPVQAVRATGRGPRP